MKDLYETLKNSSCKKKKRLTNDPGQNELRSNIVKKDSLPDHIYKTIFNLLNFKITDVIKRTYILDFIKSSNYSQILMEYIMILEKILKSKTKSICSSSNDFSKTARLISLSSYIRERDQNLSDLTSNIILNTTL